MRSWVRTAAGVIIVLLAVAVAFGLPYSLASEYGGGLGSAVSGAALVVAVAGPVVALGAWLMFPRRERAPAPVAQAPTASRTLRRGGTVVAAGLVLSLAAAVSGGVFGQAAHERARLARDTACTADERAEFQALGALQTNGDYGTGDSDGSCRASFGGRTRMDLDGLRRVAQGRGWTPEGADVYAREGKRLHVEVIDEGAKGLDISLRLT